MKLKVTYLPILGIVAVAAAQLVQPVGAPRATHTHDLLMDGSVDPQVRTILQRSCADCHSSHATQPWYAHVAPVSWLVSNDIEHGLAKLNFSDWPQDSRNLRQDVADSIDNGEMPLRSYRWVHPSAQLTAKEKSVIEHWADEH